MDLKEAKVVITGATSGIGYETAKALKKCGSTVLICGRSEDKVKKASEKLGVFGFKADVVSEKEIQGLFKFAIEKMGTVNVLINNAGFGRMTPLIDTTAEDFFEQWEVNARGVFIAGREAAKLFIENKYGNIINIGSTAAIRGFAGGSAYSSSKFAVSGLTECWRAELRPYNIRVMQVNPSEVITEFFEKAGLEVRDAEKKLKPKEIAHLITSMLSMDDIGFIPEASVWATNPWRKK